MRELLRKLGILKAHEEFTQNHIVCSLAAASMGKKVLFVCANKYKTAIESRLREAAAVNFHAEEFKIEQVKEGISIEI